MVEISEDKQQATLDIEANSESDALIINPKKGDDTVSISLSQIKNVTSLEAGKDPRGAQKSPKPQRDRFKLEEMLLRLEHEEHGRADENR